MLFIIDYLLFLFFSFFMMSTVVLMFIIQFDQHQVLVLMLADPTKSNNIINKCNHSLILKFFLSQTLHVLLTIPTKLFLLDPIEYKSKSKQLPIKKILRRMFELIYTIKIHHVKKKRINLR